MDPAERSGHAMGVWRLGRDGPHRDRRRQRGRGGPADRQLRSATRAGRGARSRSTAARPQSQPAGVGGPHGAAGSVMGGKSPPFRTAVHKYWLAAQIIGPASHGVRRGGLCARHPDRASQFAALLRPEISSSAPPPRAEMVQCLLTKVVTSEKRRAVMALKFDPTRRRLLKTGASLAATGAVASVAWTGRDVAFAQQAQPLSFQLSWIKSIQYGGFFAGVENGSFKKFGVEPTFVSGGPNMDPVANVASGQSQLGDRPIGPIVVAKEKGIPIKVIGTIFQKSPYSIMSLAKTPIKTIQELKGKSIAVSTS